MGHPNKAIFDGAIVKIAGKLFPSYADGPRRIRTDVFGNYLPRATWSFEAIGAFARNLWPFPSVDPVAVGARVPYLGKVYIEKKPLEPKLH